MVLKIIYLKIDMLIELKEDTLEEFVKSHDKVLVQFSASWCGNCRIMKPKLKKISAEYGEISFVVIDAEKNPESRKLAKVDNLPTFGAFHNGELKDQVQTNKFDVLKPVIDEIAADYTFE